MSMGWVTLIIVLVLAIIAGNILLLRHSAKFRLPKDFKPKDNTEKDDDSGW